MAVLNVYITTRDALRGVGILNRDFVVEGEVEYNFVAADGSVFVVVVSWLRGSKIVFVKGPRKGQERQITQAAVDRYRKIAEKKWGRYIPGTLFRDPRFIPGTDRKSIPLYIKEYGIPREAGYIDEKGVHRYRILGPGYI